MNKITLIRLIDLLNTLPIPPPWKIIADKKSSSCKVNNMHVVVYSTGFIDIDNHSFERLEDAAEYMKNNLYSSIDN